MIFEKKTPLNSWTRRPTRPHWLIRRENASTKDGRYTIGKIRYVRNRTIDTWELRASFNGDEQLSANDLAFVLTFMREQE